MAGKVIGSTFDYGFAGQISRAIDDIVEALPNLDTAPIAFGAPVMLTGEGVRNFKDGDDGTKFLGFCTRYTKTNETYGLGDSTCNPGDMVNVLKRGSLTVACEGTPQKGGKAYLALGADGSTVSAIAGGNTALDNVVFASGADAHGMAEVTVLTRRL